MNKLFNLIKVSTIAIVCFSFGLPTVAEDTEIYQASANAVSTGRPKVLIIFDNSGSMRTNVVTTTTPTPYVNGTSYSGSFVSGRVYWSDNGTPPRLSDDQWFSSSHNRCAESISVLANNGVFQGKAQRWRSNNNTWRDLSSGSDYDYVDCEADYLASNPSNPGTPAQADGYPVEPAMYASSGTLNWGSRGYSFYSANYMNWYTGSTTTTSTPRITIAKSVVSQLINANPAVDFGLMVFNDNSRSDNSINNGGRVVNRIITNSTAADRTALVNMVNALNAETYTPLCETTFEAYRLMTGTSVQYGLQQGAASPSRDLLAENGAIYISPTTDCAYTYIILMTDGEPTNDTDANSAIELLTGKTCNNYSGTKNCLPEIAEYMANTDLDNNTANGNQFALTYTIGFTTNQTLLSDTAAKGKGQYYTAADATTLATAFQSALTEILSTDQSFTSPAVAVDTFSRTESRNEVFFAMFKPSNTIDWPGNIKRLNISISGGVAILTDANGVPAFDPSTGRIADTATTVWSTSVDGGDVLAGGVGALLASRNLLTNPRVIYSNIGASGVLSDIDNTYANRVASGYASDAALFSAFNVADQTTLRKMTDWLRGFDVDDDNSNGSVTDTRAWIMADMLHSRPLVVNYGARGSFTEASPDQRIFAGTNGGLFHMFGIDDGQEDWAFFPKELAPILSLRRADAASTQHVYGIDAPPAAYLYDKNGDGTLDSTVGDKAYIYFGLRRGGQTIYALDVSNPDSPSYLWKIDQTTSGFSELGQTWSVPVVTKIPGYTYDHDGSALTPQIPKPVLVFGAGYDTNKDATGVGTADSMGRGIFIVDAFTGALVWSVTPAANSLTNLQETGLIHSVPATITPLDSNGDGISDRLYFGDTGGNVWRVDLPGLLNNTRPDSSQLGWFITKLADFNDGTTSTDRRFFSSPDVVRTKSTVCTTYNLAGICTAVNVVKFDAVLIGSGDRTNPNAIDVNNQFYMIRDERLEPYTTPPQTPTQCAAQLDPLTVPPIAYDFRCALNSGAGFGTGDLYNATANLLQTGTASEIATATASLNAAHGWLLDLQAASGEKSLSRAITLYGSVFFTTFSPSSGLLVSCTPLAGEGRLYQVDLIDARAKRDFNNDGTLDRTTLLGSLIPDTPSPHFGSDKKVRLLFPSGGGLLSGNPLDTGAKMPQPYGVYWYREEQ